MVEWKIFSALAGTHGLLKHTEDSQQYRAAARQSLYNLGDSIREPAHAERFRRSKAVQEFAR
jgi:hypothetical protein